MEDARVSVASPNPVYFCARVAAQSGCSGHQSFAPRDGLVPEAGGLHEVKEEYSGDESEVIARTEDPDHCTGKFHRLASAMA